MTFLIKTVKIFDFLQFAFLQVDQQITSPWVWLLGTLYGAVCIVCTHWMASAVVVQVVACFIALGLLIILDRAPNSGFINIIPKPFHFLIFGISKKYKHSCWKPIVFPSLVLTLVCAFLGYFLAVLVLSLFNLCNKDTYRRARGWLYGDNI